MEFTDEQKTLIKAQAEQSISFENRENKNPEIIDLIGRFRDMLLGEIPLDFGILDPLNIGYYSQFQSFVARFLFYVVGPENHQSVFSKKVFSYVFGQSDDHAFRWYIAKAVNTDLSFTFIKQLQKNGYDEKTIIIDCIQQERIVARKPDGTYFMNALGEYLRDKVEGKSKFLGLVKQPGYHEILKEEVFKNNQVIMAQVFALGAYFYMINPKLILDELQQFIVLRGYREVEFNNELIEFLLAKASETYSDKLNAIIDSQSVIPESKYKTKSLFLAYKKEETKKALLLLGSEYAAKYYGDAKRYSYDPRIGKVPLLNHYFGLIYDEDPEMFTREIGKFISQSYYLPKVLLDFINEKIGADIVPLLAESFSSQKSYIDEIGAKNILSILEKYDYKVYHENIIQYANLYSGKRDKKVICEHLAKQKETHSRALELLKGKKVQERVVGALILSSIPQEDLTKEIQNALNQAIDIESNDETRNIMLDAVKESRFKAHFDFDRVQLMISLAEKRRKLNKWNEKWLDEEKLPSLYWLNGKACEANAIRFLLYRMKLASGLQSDIEAKQFLRHIDRDKAEKVAESLLEAFIASNANAKLKYNLTLTGLLGNDQIVDKLHALFRKNILTKRTKMAEYVLGAIAMVGSDKALRLLEFISRKYANKKPALSAVALQSLDAAAKELDITKDQLADRIIPNFDFDGIYREFDVAGETYRAFINKEFRLIYSDESNKTRKSIPPAAAPEIKKEFKAIEKEIRAVVKSQEDRLQRYMIHGRTWNGADWDTFFFNNPIMFVYATQLLWAKLDPKSGKVIEVFYCDEDAEKYNFDDDEVEIEADASIAILHPCYLTKEELQSWKNKAFENDIKTIFPILERPIMWKLDDEMESTFSRRFDNQEIPRGADYTVQQMTKKGYLKSTGDGGYLQFSKKMYSPEITVYPNIEGPAAWYQNNEAKAIVHEISFIGKNLSDNLKIKDIPDAFYSEIMADIQSLLDAKV